MAYAYRDKYGILHVVKGMNTAQEFAANGNVVETNIKHDGGYPQVLVNNEYVDVFDYGDEIYLGGNRGSGELVDKNDPRLVEMLKLWEVLS